ncbi:MAG TPA: hypothetical protein VFT22_10265 [Kofleriaceae bacterium]|nr:hypothetical protein [Kofleriaceae bacterium]
MTDGVTIEHLKTWLLYARLLTREEAEDGAQLVLLCRANLVAAMDRAKDPAKVTASETSPMAG